MLEAHFEATTLRDFLIGQLPPEETRRVVRHLLAGCDQCQSLAESFWIHGESSAASPSRQRLETSPNLEAVLSRVTDREMALGQERDTAPSLVAELLVHPIPRQLMVIRNNSRFQTWGLCEHLLELSFDSRFDDVEKTETFAETAVAVAESLDESRYGAALVADLRARAWSHLANAQRIRSNYRTAEESFRICEAILEHGTGDPVEKGNILNFKATLRHQQGRYEDALSVLDRAAAIYRRIEDEDLLGGVLASQAYAWDALGETPRAIEMLRKALTMIDTRADARRTLAFRHTLVYMLQDTGDLESALALLKEMRPLYIELGDRLNLLRLRRTEAQIASKLGHTALAEAAFLEARNGFISAGIGHEAAEISLELATLYLETGRTTDTRQLAAQLVPIFQSQDLHQEVVAALLAFQKAAQAEAASAELVGEVLAFLQRSKEDPSLKFGHRIVRTDPPH